MVIHTVKSPPSLFPFTPTSLLSSYSVFLKLRGEQAKRTLATHGITGRFIDFDKVRV